MTVVRADADGLWMAARKLEQDAQQIAENREPGEIRSTDQATVDVVTAVHARVAGISAILVSRIEATAKRLDDAGHRYAEADDTSTSTLAE
ncbi:hypothetical protein ABIA30_003915 [Mycobacterium sp. MAA66]|uniref:hypothetical protein n=1 Tax=Mycobacterium sp. MAA66 TaxID=3156297 RepID=UPI0035161453